MESKTVHPRSKFKTRKALWLTVAAISLLVVGIAGKADANVGHGTQPRSHWFVDMSRFNLSAHANFKCDDCHGTMIENGRKHPDPSQPGFLKQEATRSFDYSRCQKCHKLSYKRYLEGQHAKALSKEMAEGNTEAAAMKKKTPAPTCGDCHSSHYDRSGQSRIVVGQRMIAVCGSCHRKQTTSFLENIHGRLSVDLKNPASALCTDCHGAHTAVGLKDPAVALPVCRRCHPKAEAEFTNFVIHASVSGLPDTDSPKRQSILWIQRIKLAAIAVVALSLIFFFGHSLLWLLRELHEKLRKH
ncbi:MAG: multiheme c-type cytochrome [Desulfobacterales bacterium]